MRDECALFQAKIQYTWLNIGQTLNSLTRAAGPQITFETSLRPIAIAVNVELHHKSDDNVY